jgi:predicted AAA+ superfamily ATPase
MRPMSLFESGDSYSRVSFASLLRGESIEPFSADIDLDSLIDITVRGGWPETLKIPVKRAGEVSVQYINTIMRNELFDDSFSKRNSHKLRTLLRALARNNATTVSTSSLALDIDGSARQEQDEADIKVSRQTTSDYIDDLKRIFVVEDIYGWSPGVRSKTRIRMAPKKVFADPSLPIAVLGITHERLAHDLNTFGFLFENLCLRDIAVYAECIGGSLFHYRDNSNAEIDAIVEMPDGSWGAFEIKLGEHQADDAAKKLRAVCSKLVSNGAPQPTCMCVITGGGYGRRRDDGVYVVPVNAMKP